MLELPNGYAALHLLDYVIERLERRAPVRGCDGDADGCLTYVEGSNPVLDRRGGEIIPRASLTQNRNHLLLGHLAVRRVVYAAHRLAVVAGPDGPEKRGDRAVSGSGDLIGEIADADGVIDDGGADHPPATGGMIAISSPSLTEVSARA